MTEKMRLTSLGNVGINTTSPGAQLHLFEPSAATSHTGEQFLISNNAITSGVPISGITTNETGATNKAFLAMYSDTDATET